MKSISETPKHTIIWAFVQDSVTGHTFWTLAIYNGNNEWVGVHGWDEQQNHDTFDYYEWLVIGWKEVDVPQCEPVTSS